MLIQKLTQFQVMTKKDRDEVIGNNEICLDFLTDSEISYLKEKLAEKGLDLDGFNFGDE